MLSIWGCRYLPYLCELNPQAGTGPFTPRGSIANRATVIAAYSVIAAMEHPLQVALVEYVKASPMLRLIGTPSTGVWDRVAQVSFLHAKVLYRSLVRSRNIEESCFKIGLHY